MQSTFRRIFNIIMILILPILIIRTTDFNNLTTLDYVFLALYVLIVILFVINTILELINKRSDNID